MTTVGKETELCK